MRENKGKKQKETREGDKSNKNKMDGKSKRLKRDWEDAHIKQSTENRNEMIMEVKKVEKWTKGRQKMTKEKRG